MCTQSRHVSVDAARMRLRMGKYKASIETNQGPTTQLGYTQKGS